MKAHVSIELLLFFDPIFDCVLSEIMSSSIFENFNKSLLSGLLQQEHQF